MTNLMPLRSSIATDVGKVIAVYRTIDGNSFDFMNFFHPLIGELIEKLNETPGDALAAVLDPSFLASKAHPFFLAPGGQYTPAPGIQVTSYDAQIDLDPKLPYANYNWELLFHIPIAVAVHLTQNQRFAEAERWFHLVFDPTSSEPPPAGAPASARFWKFLYFWQNPEALDLTSQVTLAAEDPNSATDFLSGYYASITTPFQPFAVARSRLISFQYYVVMKYLDNLIAWGDSLFSQMTVETVNEATLCYVLASNLLGPLPQHVPQIGTTQPKTYGDLKADVNAMGETLVELEGQFPFNIVSSATAGGTSDPQWLFGVGQTLYFGVPENAKLLQYWDTVESRLNQIRNCENLQGQIQLMPLFDPPIDPGMLVKAVAAGLDLASVVSGLSQPVSPIRTQPLLQKALELCAEVRSLGNNLLSAIEKGDSEQLARLRQTHEISLQAMTRAVRFLQWQQAQASTEALLRSRASALERYRYYLRLLGLQPDSTTVPDTFVLDHDTELTEDNFGDAYQALVAKYDQPIAIQPFPTLQVAQTAQVVSGLAGAGNLYLNANEDIELNVLMPVASGARIAAAVLDTLGSVLTIVPDFNVDLSYWGLGADSKVAGGVKLADVLRFDAEVLRTEATIAQETAGMASRTAGYQRRADDWLLQANLAARELVQSGRQILTSLIAEQANHHEYDNAVAQTGMSEDVMDFLQTKFTSEELYGWLQGGLSDLYYRYYRFALDTARKAEQTMKWELMRPELDSLTYVQPNYWDSGHQGLTSGEQLHLDLKRMEMDYHDYNLRELELTRHISLRQLDPIALLTLKITGTCSISIPEWFFDRDCPGHYMRRLKTVAVSVPAVVGPYTSVNCTLTLTGSQVRVSSDGTSYARDTTNDDPRFVDYPGTAQSIVTSSAVSDSGMFETNLHDERFLPFEGAGAISGWTLSLPPLPSFDYATITDVILHMRYTARDAGASLAQLATPVTVALMGATSSLALLLSLRHDFPTEWYAFTTSPTADFSALLTLDYFPYTVQNSALAIDSLTLYARNDDGTIASLETDITASITPPSLGITSKTAQLDLKADQSVLTRDASHDVFLVVKYHT